MKIFIIITNKEEIMRKFKLVLMLIVAMTVSTFAQKKEVNIEKSVVAWTGKKIGGAHNGQIQLKSGYFIFNNDQIKGGKVVIDMNSMTNLDLEDAGYRAKLIGHLKSDDFFGVEKYPTAIFELSKATKFENGKASVEGMITIKGKSEILNFDLVKNGNEFTGQLKVDRSKFDVRYGSNSFFDNLGDKAIEDIFTLDVKLTI